MGKNRSARSKYARKKGDNTKKSAEWNNDDKFKVVMENKRFEEYYKTQGIMPEDEFPTFMEKLKVILPSSFRITGSRSHAEELRDLMIATYFPAMQTTKIDGETVEAPQPLPWYPNNLAWTSSLTRTVLRKSPVLSKFHRFLVSETEVGNISRQEEVSMIPVSLLDVQSHHAVLDMCAAPGSKTAQILEALHADEGEALPTGLLIANDSDQKRSYTLVKQAKRLQSPCLMVTNHEAQRFPSLYLSDKDSSERAVFQFDRILADVPCSGDGTLRKNGMIWNRWTCADGLALHRIQLPILYRACTMTKIGGRIVYSTCSFNPLENEAVVAAAVKASNGSIRIVDVSDQLPGLKRRPGMTTWKVQDKTGEWYNSMADVFQKGPSGMIRETMFPPEDIKELGLERALRLYPQDQNTGGFFVCVLEKVGPMGSIDRFLAGEDNELDEEKGLPTATEATVEDGNQRSVVVPNDRKRRSEDSIRLDIGHVPRSFMPNCNSLSISSPESKRLHTTQEISAESREASVEAQEIQRDTDQTPDSRSNGKLSKRYPSKTGANWEGSEAPFTFLPEDHPVITQLRDFYGISEEFPMSSFLIRSLPTTNPATVYFAAPSIRRLITSPSSHRLKIVNTGIRIFTKNSANSTEQNSVNYRLVNEGMDVISSFVDDRRVVICERLSEIRTLLAKEYPKFEDLGDLGIKIATITSGSCIVRYDPHTDVETKGHCRVRHVIQLPIWRAAVSVSLLMNKQERCSLLERLCGEELGFEGGLDKDLPNAIKTDAATETPLMDSAL
ncbi:tRNA (cytosine(34)-C(5))-methyltransferase [Gaertneriomyces sp. JEL0708]|nr:tRNA (cytosine(34)-C(5))-methyltransferase [Gaertneriomyces sp. JEL0708]